MKKKLPIFIISLLFVSACKHKSFEACSYNAIESKVDSTILVLKGFEKTGSTQELKRILSRGRKHYKEIEPFVEYYFQGISRRINGPALPEIKTDDNMVNEASGFQVIEEIIYNDNVELNNLKKQAKILSTDLLFIKNNIRNLPIKDQHFYELVQHQIIRIATLGITGFDSPVAFQSLEEARFSLEGIIGFYNLYCNSNSKKGNEKLLLEIAKAIKYLNQNSDFDSFNRLIFIKDHLMPLSVLWEIEFEPIIRQMPNFKSNKVFSGSLADLMQGRNLNPDVFSPFAESESTPQKIALGKLLFNEKSLSKTSTMSCATCHNADKAFSDGKKLSVNNIHSSTSQRNSPTLLYSAFQKAFFYDMKSQDLENQIESVMNNPDEFNLSPEEISQRVSANLTLSKKFVEAYPNIKKISSFEVRNAIAAYVRSLLPFSSKIDNYFKGKTALTQSEINGFNLFTGKAKCATCHFVPLYNGTIPPWFNTSESEVIGVPKNLLWNNAEIDIDLGRYQFNQIEQLKFSFKTPTIRNIEKTGPYMHNGVYSSLDEVVRFYELGGGNGIGMDLEYQTLPFDKLQLNDSEKQDIVSFLKCLSDTSNFSSH